MIETYTSTTKTEASDGRVFDGTAVVAEAEAPLSRRGVGGWRVVVSGSGLGVDGSHWRRFWIWRDVELTKRLRWWVVHAMALVLLYASRILVIRRIFEYGLSTVRRGSSVRGSPTQL